MARLQEEGASAGGDPYEFSPGYLYYTGQFWAGVPPFPFPYCGLSGRRAWFYGVGYHLRDDRPDWPRQNLTDTQRQKLMSVFRGHDALVQPSLDASLY